MAKANVGSPVSWWGGKGTIGPRIRGHFPMKFKKYVEVFGGGGHILFQKDKSEEEYYNDLHDGLITMFTQLKSEDAMELKRRLELTPNSRAEFDHCRDTWREEPDPIEKARKFYVTVNQSFSSGLKNWKAAKGGKGVAKNTSKFYATLNNRFDFAHQRLSNVTIENMDYKDLLAKHDGAYPEEKEKAQSILDSDEIQTDEDMDWAKDILARRDAKDVLFYIDPPYIGETRTLQKGYDHEMTDLTLHRELVEILLRLKGKAVLSGYDHPVYDKLIDEGWFKIDLGEYAKSSAFNEIGGTKNKENEIIWVNYDPAKKFKIGREKDEQINGEVTTA